MKHDSQVGVRTGFALGRGLRAQPPRSAPISRAIGWGLLICAVAVAAVALPPYWQYLGSTVAISALIARSVGVLTNQLGVITLCQMGFASIGGWVVSWLSLREVGVSYPVMLLFAALVTLPVGVVLGWATSRIRGAELAVVTLGVAAALDLVLRQGSFPGVGQGIAVRPDGLFADSRWFFVLMWAIFLGVCALLAAHGRSRSGLAWSAIRASERSAASFGIRVRLSKTLAFGVSAALAGVGGGMLAGQYGLLTTAVFSPLTSLVHLVTAVLCGAGLMSGAFLAGLLSVALPELLRRVGAPLDVGQALLAIGAFDVLRRGNGGLAEQAKSWLEDRRYRNARVHCSWPDLGEIMSVGQAHDEVLRVANLTVTYGAEPVIDAVSFALRQDEVHALLGPNGAGKTTFIDAVSGYVVTDQGEITLRSQPLNGRSVSARARLGLRRTFQQLRVVGSVTVGQYLRLAAGGAGLAAQQRASEMFGLPDADVPVRRLDPGTRRILEIAGALASQPRVLLLDEPAAGLGETDRQLLAARIAEIPRRFGCGVVLIEHDMTFVRQAASAATLLIGGKVFRSGPVAEVLSDPLVIAAYSGTPGVSNDRSA